jgi:purine nucleoside permease
MFPGCLAKRLICYCCCLLFCLSISFSSLTLLSSAPAHAQGKSGGPLPIKVFIITMFSLEAKPWLDNIQWPLTYTVPGADNVVHCSFEGICLTITGADKVNAATSMTAILSSPDFLFNGTYFLTAGTASTPPNTGTLGFTAWANWVVDWDQGEHLLPATIPGVPYGYIAPNTTYPDSTSVFHLNEHLAQWAYNLTAHLSLQDTTAAMADRRLYPGQANKHPYVARCDTITGDTIWIGKQLSNEAQYITSTLTNHAGTNCTSEAEDTAVATVLQRFGHLDHYLNLRGASAFNQPAPSQTLQEFLTAHFRANDIATANLYLVASTVANHLLQTPPNI